ncbi:hypothetical protein THAOC_22688 [Thalassiosira oceanica]|uniref:Uncharacterized protein n=1 Tax=Thalassiosira oceanica TaxID=159749 RepID=K0RXV1_THAOC|nr:hypothetical protein THAOC_22688 [Thalassiosira oceanica]|eukprot:EJK57284.1 hypothetical protein THAOC_22688 [Thalassiosira oceanica]
MKETLLRKHIPNIVVRHFMHLVRKTCNLPTREYDVHCALCAQACEAQASLGTEAILQGYLVKEWTSAITQHYRPPPAPTNNPSGTHALHITSAQDARDTARILHFKEHHTTTLRQCDWNRVAFPVASLATWRRRTRKDLLRSLERLHRLYLDEQRLATQGQRTLTNWLQSGSNPT